MTVRDLIELNQMITDVTITVRKNGTALLDELNIGCERGVEPKFPHMVPKEERYIGNICHETKKKAAYMPKSINSWDDGHDYWNVKVDRIPKRWLDLEVDSWEVWPASYMGDNPRRYRNVNFHGERINITALPSGERLEVVPEQKTEKRTDIEGQIEMELIT